ncbi:ribonuclease P protein subunit [Candidatus Woesearchaeota archaeon]|nr:ribonuclease P protein subunit [Candidatus Woesearchaeota archaeon]
MGVKDISRSELIGLSIEITESENKSLIGLRGKIIDETKNILTLDTKNGIKKIIKSQVKFKMETNNRKIEVNGKLITNRPEDRLKRTRKI